MAVTSDDPGNERDPVERLTEEFVAGDRRGERPSALEHASASRSGPSASTRCSPLSCLWSSTHHRGSELVSPDTADRRGLRIWYSHPKRRVAGRCLWRIRARQIAIVIDRDDLRREWLELSQAWIMESRHGKNAIRIGLLDFPMLEACGNVHGMKILDCGCGEGRFCRMLVARGAAAAVGLDTCEPLIQAARDLQSEREIYRVADVQDLGFIEDEAFDLAISYLNQCDLPDFHANTRGVARVLRRGGRFIVANLHPMRSAVGGWHRTPDGMKQHVILDNYFQEGERHWTMLDVSFTNFHRSLSTYTRGFLDAGFRIGGIIEPTISAESLSDYPELDDERRVPNFIIYILQKP
jgi:SAM-dependent methyltransferase